MSLAKRLLLVLLFVSAISLVSCAPVAMPSGSNKVAAAPEAVPVQPAEPKAEKAVEPLPAQPEVPAEEADNTVYNTGADASLTTSAPGLNRKIIKNAELQLLVEDTDVTIDRVTQVAVDVGGYIISSKSWFKDEIGGKYKYATISLGVPVDDFERALRRLRELSIKVENEVATGENVSQEYIDLQSKLESLQATRARITGFLNDAKTVEVALQINDQLAQVEQQINETSGRMNYLAGRATFSTITVTINPRIRDVTPTLTASPTITQTPLPTLTPTPWNPSKVVGDAGNKLGETYRGMAEVLIWFFVYVLPFLAPWAILALVIYLFRRRSKKQSNDK